MTLKIPGSRFGSEHIIGYCYMYGYFTRAKMVSYVFSLEILCISVLVHTCFPLPKGIWKCASSRWWPIACCRWNWSSGRKSSMDWENLAMTFSPSACLWSSKRPEPVVPPLAMRASLDSEVSASLHSKYSSEGVVWAVGIGPGGMAVGCLCAVGIVVVSLPFDRFHFQSRIILIRPAFPQIFRRGLTYLWDWDGSIVRAICVLIWVWGRIRSLDLWSWGEL